jgi:aminoglycoside phosphotransferase family enzyme/predicted kinase
VTTTRPAAVAETHSAAVFFLGDRAYKVKKPVELGFLDFRTRQARHDICHREVTLNRRLAPDVYLGVADVHGPNGELCDHLVVMRRMPPERRLSTLVEAGDRVDDHLWQLAHLLAAFHAQAERSPAADEAARAHALGTRWADNTASLLDHSHVLGERNMVEHVHELARRYLAGRQPLFERRIAEGRACDGHGDLLADDIFCLDDAPRVIDCVEFDDQLRYGDVLADVAFLAMDLDRLGHPELARRFLAAYCEHANDTWPASLADHHVAYRAHVRAKVSAIRAAQGDADSAAAARRLLEMTHGHLEDARVRLVLVGGLPGTGKSTLAAGLGDALGATVLRSDEVRKELAGMSVTAPAEAAFGEGIYTPGFTAAAYEALLRRARIALELGETVILDASWTDQQWRAEAEQVARRVEADLVQLECQAPAELAATRLRQRAEARQAASGVADSSDATPDIAQVLAQTAAPWPAATTIDTSTTSEAALTTALGRVQGCDMLA